MSQRNNRRTSRNGASRSRQANTASDSTASRINTDPRGAGPLDPEFRPALQGYDLVELAPSGDWYVVDATVPQPEIAHETITVAANDSVEDEQIADLEQDNNWLGQFRLLHVGQDVDDGINVTMDHGGREAPFWTANNARGQLLNNTGSEQGYDEANGAVTTGAVHTQLSELFVFEDDTPYVTLQNTTDAEVDVDLSFSGYQYRLEHVNPSDVPASATPTVVPTARIRGE